MIIVRLLGGLGNQMFQYAAGLRLATMRSTTLKLDLMTLLDRTPTENFVFRDFDLGIFNLNTPVASLWDTGRFRRQPALGAMGTVVRAAGKLMGCRTYIEPYDARFEQSSLSLGKQTYLVGFFQDQRYFIDIERQIRQQFRIAPNEADLPPGTRELADRIRRDRSVCIHVRRGDTVTHPKANAYQGVLSMKYNMDALTELRKHGQFGHAYVFSDDAAWCRENFSDASQFTVVGDEHSGPRSAHHFWLMTLCSGFVIPNSTFSWWAAWLSEADGKVVARPARWNREDALADRDICPSSWIKVSNTF